MLKADAQTRAAGTRGQMVEAALQTLKEEGFKGASARAIARRAGLNQALIFYHFGSVTNLLLAALDETSRRRMRTYEAAVSGARSLEDLVNAAIEAYREDLSSGHITVLSEMIAGSLSDPQLASDINARVEPWIDFAQRTLEGVLSGSPIGLLLPSRDLAFAVVSFYLGVDLLAHLDADRPEPRALFAAATQLAPLAAGLAGR